MDRSVSAFTLNARADVAASHKSIAVWLAEPEVESAAFCASAGALGCNVNPRYLTLVTQAFKIKLAVKPMLFFEVEDDRFLRDDGPISVRVDAGVDFDFFIGEFLF
jgi:hypothetical protein